MEGKCKKIDCPAPISCLDLCDSFEKCENWIHAGASVNNDTIKDQQAIYEQINWSGNSLNKKELSLISSRISPILFGLIGRADAGKTSFLGIIYTLLLNGKKFNKFNFAGSKTIIGWENLAFALRLKKGKIDFPEPTPSNPNYYSFLHLSLRDNDGNLKEILFTDTSGEVFSQWAYNKNDYNSESARWIHNNADAFILFVDCEALLIRRNSAKTEIIDIARQLANNLNNRPVVVLWSKSDKISEVKEVIRKSLKEDLKEIFNSFSEIEVSNHSKSDDDELCHKNNLMVIDWLLNEINKPSNLVLEPKKLSTKDFFLNYRG